MYSFDIWWNCPIIPLLIEDQKPSIELVVISIILSLKLSFFEYSLKEWLIVLCIYVLPIPFLYKLLSSVIIKLSSFTLL